MSSQCKAETDGPETDTQEFNNEVVDLLVMRELREAVTKAASCMQRRPHSRDAVHCTAEVQQYNTVDEGPASA